MFILLNKKKIKIDLSACVTFFASFLYFVNYLVGYWKNEMLKNLHVSL